LGKESGCGWRASRSMATPLPVGARAHRGRKGKDQRRAVPSKFGQLLACLPFFLIESLLPDLFFFLVLMES
jgi:hypothetical protein